jgi:hypothetical protein
MRDDALDIGIHMGVPFRNPPVLQQYSAADRVHEGFQPLRIAQQSLPDGFQYPPQGFLTDVLDQV